MWSAGAVITALFAGQSIFAIQAKSSLRDGSDESELISNAILKSNLSDIENDTLWREMSHHALALVKSLLISNQNDRLNASAALAHPWFSDNIRKRYQELISTWQPSLVHRDFDEEIESFLAVKKLKPKVLC